MCVGLFVVKCLPLSSLCYAFVPLSNQWIAGGVCICVFVWSSCSPRSAPRMFHTCLSASAAMRCLSVIVCHCLSVIICHCLSLSVIVCLWTQPLPLPLYFTTLSFLPSPQLQMLGQPIEWAAFRVIEVMTQVRVCVCVCICVFVCVCICVCPPSTHCCPHRLSSCVRVPLQERFSFKRTACLTASQSFTADTDVIVLCTQLFKKDFQAINQFQIGLAINCLSNIATPELAQDLLEDVVKMLTSSKDYIRKRAVLCLYKLFLKFPQGLRLSFEALKRRLSDTNPSVRSARCTPTFVLRSFCTFPCPPPRSRFNPAQ